jgi:predicted Zn-ribbon and HTH transcriptional regulator
MTDKEIAYSYRHAVNKIEQVQILSELTLKTVDEIIEILKREGALDPRDIRHRICCRCGREYEAIRVQGIAVCPTCQNTTAEIQKKEYKIKLNIAKIATRLREVGSLADDNIKLREEIERLKGVGA